MVETFNSSNIYQGANGRLPDPISHFPRGRRVEKANFTAENLAAKTHPEARMASSVEKKYERIIVTEFCDFVRLTTNPLRRRPGDICVAQK